ncbi:CEP164 [Symbiodinium sp. CCMP2592]|nr:CEP164 [Symbiodinium sp. CCMP2592]
MGTWLRPFRVHVSPRTEGGLGDLGFSSESEGVDIAAQTSEASEADFKEYAKSLGVELEKDVDLVWVAREAFEAPLPASWSEHLDQERRIYFFNQVTQQSSWNHPMDEVFRDLLQLIKSVRRLDPPEASVVEAVQTHLQSCHDRASAALEGWSGPYAAEDGEYFYHAEQGVSTWHNPVEEWQTELSVRQQVLHRCLLHESPPNKAANGIARGRGASRDTSPPALPLHLARPMAEGATPPSPSSARSFATCISARSTSITPRSRRPSLCASEARWQSKPLSLKPLSTHYSIAMQLSNLPLGACYAVTFLSICHRHPRGITRSRERRCRRSRLSRIEHRCWDMPRA